MARPRLLLPLRRAGLDLPGALRRLAASAPAIGQIVAAVMAAYALCRWGLGHEVPFLAVTVCITSLGFARDARPRSVLETASGIVFGVLFANLALLLVGRGWWQLAIVLATVMAAARLVVASPGFAVAASVQCSLVMLIPLNGAAEGSRILDALVGGATAILATALVPRNARRLAREEAERLFDTLESALTHTVEALRKGDTEEARAALEELRGTQRNLDRWAESLDSARSIARLSPWLRGHRQDVAGMIELWGAMDLITRNLRIVARRIWSFVGDGRSREELADVMGLIESGLKELRLGMDDPQMRDRAKQTLTMAAVKLDPEVLAHTGRIGETMLVMQCRPLLVDLLSAAGVPPERARRMLPRVR